MGRIDKLAERYRSFIALPWQKDLAGAQRAIFIVYDKVDERRLRARKDLFELATKDAGHGWIECDVTDAFAEWMASTEYRESYFESPQDLDLKLARGAGGDAPLPERPDIRHLSDLQSLAGNEQLLAVLGRHDQLSANHDEWTKASKLAEERLPAFQRLQALARHADGLDAAEDAKPRIEAIVADRRLLDPSDPVPGLASKLTDALRAALAHSRERHDETCRAERKRLEATESWRQIEPQVRDEILARLHIERVSRAATGTEQEVLESLDRISLDGWRARTAALPRWFADARAEADRLVEPKIRHVKLESATLRTPEDVKAWTETTERELLEQIRHGSIVIG